jgi:hypothetical protein
MTKRVMAAFFILLGAILFVSPAQAQRRSTSGHAPVRRAGFVPLHRFHRSNAGSTFPYFYSDYDSEGELIGAPPESMAVQPVQPASPAPLSSPPESLMLELQGDRWVRITNHGVSQGGEEPEQTSQPSTASRMPDRAQTAPPSPLPLAVLVFRDGHKEEIEKYVIVGPTIYADSDYWRSGSWTRKVPIADLNISATLELNRERGARFNLPSGPNEVVFRP